MTREGLIERLDKITREILVLDLELSEEENESLVEEFKEYLKFCGYDVENYGSLYPLLLIGIRNNINPN